MWYIKVKEVIAEMTMKKTFSVMFIMLIAIFGLIGCGVTSDPPSWYGKEPPPWYGQNPPDWWDERDNPPPWWGLERHPMSDLVIPTHMEIRIRKDYINLLGLDTHAMGDVYIHRYFGTFNNAVVIVLRNDDGTALGALPFNQTIAGFNFTMSHDYRYLVWVGDEFYTWLAAYILGILSKDDISEIYEFF